ncbi:MULTISPECIES: MFS transporter [Acinetobacter]|uniref:MFS transporter n=1 Tax=Acinetobacter TaxID=469 RepID=UPI00195B6FF0|nr:MULTISPECIES: MFS transporter [Acinetobacter]MBM7142428.1 MFS transporter [Acinetobacter sp. 105-3]
MSVSPNNITIEESQKYSESYRWIVLGVAVTAQTLASVVSQGMYTLVPFFKSAFNLTQAQAGLTITAMNGGQILSMVLLGIAMDRYGERGVVTITMIAMGLTAILAATFSTSYYSLMFFLIMIGVWYASVQPGGTQAIMRWFPPHLRGVATGVRQAGLPLGTAMAAIALPWLAVAYDWKIALYVQGVIGILGGILFGVFHRDDIGQLNSNNKAKTSISELVKLLLKQPTCLAVLFAGITMAAFQYTFATHILLFLSKQLEIPLVTAAFFFAIAQGVGIAGRISLAGVSDKLWPGKRMRSLVWLMIACSGLICALLLLPVHPPIWIIITLFVFLGLFGIGWYPLWLLQVAEMAPKTAIASTVSFAMTLNLIAICALPPIFGFIVDMWGYGMAWGLIIVLLLLSAFRLSRNTTNQQ